MTRRLYLDPEEFAADEVNLSGSRARRLREVLRLRDGAQLEVFDGQGRQRAARIITSGRGLVTLAVGEAIAPVPDPPIPVVVVCAFPRASRGDWLVEKATEVGVAQLIPRVTARSVLDPGDGRYARWRRISIEAAEQCERCFIPAIGGEPPAGATHIVADPEATTSIRETVEALPQTPEADRAAHRPGGRLERERARGVSRCRSALRVARPAADARRDCGRDRGGANP